LLIAVEVGGAIIVTGVILAHSDVGKNMAHDISRLSDWVMSQGADDKSDRSAPASAQTSSGAAAPPPNNDDKPKRVTNPKHHPGSESPEPSNVQELFDKSVPDKTGVRWAQDTDGTIHRFSKPSNGESHWNGSTSGVDPIKLENIPIDIRRGFPIK
jgi:hypothetical protein